MTQVAPVPAVDSEAAAGAPWTAKRASQVARSIEHDIVTSGRPAGTSIGSESELATRYTVSRTVLREAVRILEHQHVASMRMGPGGGLTVREPDRSALVHAAQIHLRYAGTTLEHVVEARRVLEPLAAALAADDGTEEAMVELRAALAAETAWGTRTKTGRAQEELVAVVAAASGNAAVRLFTELLLRLTERYATYPGEAGAPGADLLSTAQQLEMGHSAVVDAITAGDSVAASFRQQGHLEALAGSLTQVALPGPLHAEAGSKLAERTAAAIADTIAAQGWPVGQVLGSEPALQAAYGVSRAVLREAVRILEHHRIAVMRRGPGGGLVVARPDRQACTQALALRLQTEQLSLRSLYAVRRGVELRIVDLVAARMAEDPDVVAVLRESLETEKAMHREGKDAFSCDVHAALAASCGNPVLALLSGVLSHLWSRTVELRDPAFDWCDASDTVVGVHAKIAAALIGGDRDLARRRMGQHLDALSLWWS